MEFSVVLRSIRERWQWVLGGCVAGGLVAALLVLFTPDEYASTSVLYVSTQAEAENASAAYQGSLLSEQRIRSYTGLIVGDRVKGAVASELNLEPDALDDALTATAQPDTVLISVTATGRSAEEAADIANATSRVVTALVAELEQPLDRAQPPTVAIRVVQPAVTESGPVAPRPVLWTAAGLLIGLIFGLLASLAASRLDTSIKSVKELEQLSGAPSLGEVPAVKELEVRSEALTDREFAAAGESFRKIRNSLRFISVGSNCKVFVVTSPEPGDGKSTTTSLLAWAIGASGARALIIDGDMRRSRIAKYLGVDASVGLSDTVAGRIDLTTATQRIGRLGVDMLAAGTTPPNPSELLSSERMNELIGVARSRYDVVLIDTPPALAVSDPGAVGVFTDGAILVAHWGRSTRDSVSNSVQHLRQSGCKVVGCILVGDPVSAQTYYGPYSQAVASSGEGLAGSSESSATTVGLHLSRESRPSPAPKANRRH